MTGAHRHTVAATKLKIGHTRVSTGVQDLTAQRAALAVCRADDTLIVTKLDWLARSPPDAHDGLPDQAASRLVNYRL